MSARAAVLLIIGVVVETLCAPRAAGPSRSPASEKIDEHAPSGREGEAPECPT
jgi:hypothetical protein